MVPWVVPQRCSSPVLWVCLFLSPSHQIRARVVSTISVNMSDIQTIEKHLTARSYVDGYVSSSPSPTPAISLSVPLYRPSMMSFRFGPCFRAQRLRPRIYRCDDNVFPNTLISRLVPLCLCQRRISSLKPDKITDMSRLRPTSKSFKD